jgi:hypothetical protein
LLAALKVLAGLLPFLSTLASWLEDWRRQKEAERLARASIDNAEVEAAHAVAEVLANGRTPSDVVKRLRDGSF